jgi:integrase
MTVCIQARRRADGSRYFTAHVRVKPYPNAAKSFPTRKEALEWGRSNERELKRQAERGQIREDVPRLTLGALIAEFLSDPGTRALGYYDDLEKLLAWWAAHRGSERIVAFNVLKIREDRETLRTGGRRGRKPATVNRFLSAMRSCWNWGRSAGLVPQEQTWPERVMLTEPRGRVRCLSDEELASLLKAAARHSSVMHAAVVISLGCGVRQGELLRLKWANVDVERQQLRIVRGKNTKADGESRSRSIYIPPPVCETLRALRRAPVVGQRVICDQQGQGVDKDWLAYHWKDTRQAAGLQDFKWHDLRHSCASFLAQNGANLLEIGSVLGHKSVSATLRYAHLVDAKPVTGHAGLEAKLREGAK